MKKKGFTLIELLAVIVVLAIIALIATPIVMNTIKSAKKGAAERTVENYIDAVETAVATKRLDGNILEGTYKINDKGNLEGNGLKEPLEIEMSGNKPTKGTITISNGQVTTASKMTIGSYEVAYNSTTKKYEATEKESTTPDTSTTYANGEAVYFNVTTGEKCTSSEYTETQSNTGVKEGCMKFYAFNDEGEDTVNLILDHNTTTYVEWISSNSNASGPKEVLNQLKTDTDAWLGTEAPSNYIMDQTGQTSNANYTIDYSSYKARLITAQEIATITGNTSWDEKLSTSGYYYVHDNSTTEYKGEVGTNKYAWLFDNMKSCTTYGCNIAETCTNCSNVPGFSTSGYWTASSRASCSSSAWTMFYHGSVGRSDSCDGVDGRVDGADITTGNAYGVRPVIEVLKSKLS